MQRRDFLQSSLAAGFALGSTNLLSAAPPPAMLIIDTHQHLWDLSFQKLPWLQGGGPLAKNFTTKEYLEATSGLNVQAVYMEVDVAAEQKREEVEHVVKLARDPATPTLAAVVGGDPAGESFGDYVKFLSQFPEVRGVRQVLHGGHKKGKCLEPAMVKSVQLLGEKGLSFDLCMRSADLADGLELTRLAPDTRYVVDHCGNMDPKAFTKSDAESKGAVAQWQRDIAALAERPNTICKISGIIGSVPDSPTAEMLAPVVNHCLNSFGPERVVFGGDWPVCLMGAPLKSWITVLQEIIAERPADVQQKLWSGNAIRFYKLKKSLKNA